MKITIFTSSPNKDGLTAACGEAARQGAMEAGADVFHVDLNAVNVGKCRACGNGWGTCREEHYCQVEDDFQKLHGAIGDSDAYVIVTPVYWGEMSESAKSFFDRLRRCEATRRDESLAEGKPMAAVAAAGGSGGGTITCLLSMQNLWLHMGGSIFDLIPITRKTREYKLDTIKACVKEMAHLRK